VAEPALDATARTRFARQILLHEIGARGQSRLLETRFDAPATRAGGIAADYLERAGLGRGRIAEGALALALPPEGSSDESGTPASIRDALAGSFAAVEMLKQALDLGHAHVLDLELLNDPRDAGAG